MDLSRDQLHALLMLHEGNVTRVAAAVGKERSQLYRWLKRHGMNPAEYREDEDSD